MSPARNADAVAALLGLPKSASEAQFLATAFKYDDDSRAEYARGNNVHGATLVELSALARTGAALRRHEAALRVLALLCAAAPEVIPVDARVTTNRGGSLWAITVHGGDVMIVRAFHADSLTAVRNASRALLAREGAEGPACDALREAVST